MIPAWFRSEEGIGGCPCCTSLGRGRGDFVNRTLLGITGFLKGALFSQDWVRQDGLLQRIHPAAKLLGILILVVSASLTHRIEVLLGLHLITVVLAGASRIPVRRFLKRVWLLAPLFSFFMVLPAPFLVPGEPLVTVLGVSATRQGVAAAALLIARVGASVGLMTLLVLTTPWESILKALRSFRLPPVFLLTLSMTYRFVYLLLSVIEEEHLAKKSRTIDPRSLSHEQGWVASRIAHLFRRSEKLATEVYEAMVARGYDGYVIMEKGAPWRALDRAGVVAALLIGFLAATL